GGLGLYVCVTIFGGCAASLEKHDWVSGVGDCGGWFRLESAAGTTERLARLFGSGRHYSAFVWAIDDFGKCRGDAGGAVLYGGVGSVAASHHRDCCQPNNADYTRRGIWSGRYAVWGGHVDCPRFGRNLVCTRGELAVLCSHALDPIGFCRGGMATLSP